MKFNRRSNIILFLLLTSGTWGILRAQDIDFNSLLQRVDTVENPVYKPVVSVGYGVLNFIGDVKNSYGMPVIGNPALQASVSTFIDNKHYINANFFFLMGMLNGNQVSPEDPSMNLNFSTNIYSIGVTASYEFGHLIPENVLFRPYVALGVEQINFNTKGDLFDKNGDQYFYWPDGTIRNVPPGSTGPSLPLYRDYDYETDLRSYERKNYNLGDYNPRSIGIPLELGISLKVSHRVYLRIGTQFHYTFTDYIDNVSYKGTHVAGKKGNDAYMFSHITLHFDMFSDPTTRTVDLLYADVDMDSIFYDDEDGDFILDVADHCPETPYGVVTDTLGCPLDSDGDGVPDYKDKEPGTPAGVWVDDDGVTLPENKFLASLRRDSAMDRKDVDLYMALYESTIKSKGKVSIPDKFKVYDTDNDGEISFDELLKVIDEYFDLQIDLSINDLRELNEFFFSQ